MKVGDKVMFDDSAKDYGWYVPGIFVVTKVFSNGLICTDMDNDTTHESHFTNLTELRKKKLNSLF